MKIMLQTNMTKVILSLIAWDKSWELSHCKVELRSTSWEVYRFVQILLWWESSFFLRWNISKCFQYRRPHQIIGHREHDEDTKFFQVFIICHLCANANREFRSENLIDCMRSILGQLLLRLVLVLLNAPAISQNLINCIKSFSGNSKRGWRLESVLLRSSALLRKLGLFQQQNDFKPGLMQ